MKDIYFLVAFFVAILSFFTYLYSQRDVFEEYYRNTCFELNTFGSFICNGYLVIVFINKILSIFL